MSHAYNKSAWCGMEWNIIRERYAHAYDSIVYLMLDDDIQKDNPFNILNNGIDVSQKTAEEIANLIYRQYLHDKGISVTSFNNEESIIDAYPELKNYLFKQLEQARKNHPSFSLLRIDDCLFPKGIPELHNMESINDDNSEKTVKEIVAGSWSKEKNHLVLEGEEGMGKTVTLLSLPDRIAPHIIPAVYVQLRELNGAKGFVEYIRDKYFSHQESLYKSFLQLAFEPWGNGPQVLLLLDGFNEIAQDNRFKIGEEISRLSYWPGVQIVISSRFDIHPYVPFGEGYYRIMLQLLSRQSVFEYLRKEGITHPPKKNILEIINNPSMLSLYTGTEKAMANINNKDKLHFYAKNDSAGSIVWNYLQWERWRYRTDSIEHVKSVLAIDFIAPYLAWQMHKNKRDYIDKNSFRELVRQGCMMATLMKADQFRESVSEVLSRHGGMLPDESEMTDFLVNKLNLFVRKGNSYSLRYQSIRDALSALHLINVSYFSSELSQEWMTPIDYNVMSFLTEWITQEEADRLWEQNRDLYIHSEPATINMLEIQGVKRDYDYSQLNFSGLDLRNISMFPYRAPGSIKLQLPRSAKLCERLLVSEKTFYPEGHSGGVSILKVSSDGKRCVSGSDDNTLRLWDLESRRCLMTFEGHEDAISALDITLDGKRCVSGSLDNTLRVWDMESGKCIKIFKGHKYPVTALAITPDGKRCVSGAFDETLRVWDLESCEFLMPLIGHRGSVRTLAITRDGKRCVSGSDDKTLNVWDLDSGKCLWKLEGKRRGNMIINGHKDSISVLAITPDGRRCISGSWDKTLCVWDMDYGQCLMTLKGHTDSINVLAIAPDGRRCVSGAWDKTLRVWDMNSGKCLKVYKGHNDIIRSLAFYNEKSIISCSWDESLRVWNNEETGFSWENIGRKESVLAILSDGQRCVTGSDDNSLSIWNLESGEYLWGFEGRRESVPNLAITPDGKRCVSRSDDNVLRVWDLESNICLRVIDGQESPIRLLAITPDGRRCICVEDDNTFCILDLKSRRCLKRLKEHRGKINAITITPDGRKCISGSWDKTICILDLESWESLILKGHSRAIDTLAITPDGKRCISGSRDKTIRIWDVESGELLKTLKGHNDSIRIVAISPNGKRCVSWADDKTISIWDLDSGECIRTIKDIEYSISALAFTSDGSKIACWTWDAHVRIWIMESGQWQYEHTGPKKPLCSIALTPDSKRCVAGSSDGIIYEWVYNTDYEEIQVYPISVLPASLIGVDFSRFGMESITLRNVLKQNGVRV